jgi:hypothetical protein
MQGNVTFTFEGTNYVLLVYRTGHGAATYALLREAENFGGWDDCDPRRIYDRAAFEHLRSFLSSIKLDPAENGSCPDCGSSAIDGVCTIPCGG